MLFALASNHLNVDVNIKKLIGEIGVAPIVTQVDLLDLIVLFSLL
jgi:hypothetical protein